MTNNRDAVDGILDQWRAQRPDLDPSPMAIIGRLSRVSHHWDRQIAVGLAQYELEPSEFDVLATLRRHGKPFVLTAGDLMRSSMLTSGAITQRIDRLEGKGLVRRVPHPTDRRVVMVRLQSAGLKLVDQALEGHLANEERMLESLNAKARSALANLLRQLLLNHEA